LPIGCDHSCELPDLGVEKHAIRVVTVSEGAVVPVAKGNHIGHPKVVALRRRVWYRVVWLDIMRLEAVDAIAECADRMQLLPVM
jgi:predicted ribosome-associated RNA-binding protein Tma20